LEKLLTLKNCLLKFVHGPLTHAALWTHCFAMTQAGRIEPTVQALIQNSTFVYKYK